MFSKNDNFGKESTSGLFHTWAIGSTAFRILTEDKEVYNERFGKTEIKCNALIKTENGALVNEVKIVKVNAALGNALKEAFVTGLYEETYPMKFDVVMKRVGTTKEDTKYTVLLSPKIDTPEEYEVTKQTKIHDIRNVGEAPLNPIDIGTRKVNNVMDMESNPNPDDIPW